MGHKVLYDQKLKRTRFGLIERTEFLVDGRCLFKVFLHVDNVNKPGK